MTNFQPGILDIRRNEFEESIPEQVIAGLSSKPKTLPSLLFYSSEGIQHWIRHSTAPDFYPRHEELHILRSRAVEIAASIAQDSVVVDLGSASPEKVLLLLEALEMAKKNITYYALDISFSGLQSALNALPIENFNFVRVGALYGTFEDGVHWLKETSGVKDLPHTLLLFGLTIGNFSRTDAISFLRDIADGALAANPDKSSILLSLDSCKVPTKVLRAYTAEGVCPFALASLEYGNSLFIQKETSTKSVFQVKDWHFLSEWNYRLGRHEASLITRGHDVRLGAPLDGIVVEKHEKVLFGCSYKYDAGERKGLFMSAGLKAVNEWSTKGCDVAFYQLKL